MNRTKIRFIIGSLAVTAMLSFAIVALAGNPHFVGNVRVDSSGNPITASGKVAGLGNGDVAVVELNAQISYRCINPGGHQVEAHSGTATGSSEPFSSSRNGSQNFTVEASLDSGGCPNSNWTEIIDSVSGTLTLVVNGQVRDSRNF